MNRCSGWQSIFAWRHSISSLNLLLLLLTALHLGCGEHHASRDSRSHSGDPPAATSATVASAEAIQFFDVTAQCEIDFLHDDGSYGKFLLPETMSGGVAVFDYDRDGLSDIYFCNGAPLDPVSTTKPRGPALYKNLGAFRFVEVTRAAGLSNSSFGLGVTVGDCNDDGWPDLFLSNFGRNTLYLNDGSGAFFDVSVETGSFPSERFSAGASFLDADRDGDLDLFIANYVSLARDDLEKQAQVARTMYPGPQDFPPDSCELWFNTGDGLWLDASESSRIAAVQATGMGCVAGDFDSDGDTDIYVANDELPNSLFRNDGSGAFDEVAVSQGVAVDGMGIANGSMGADAGDVDNDGRFDLIVTSFENEAVTLYRGTDHAVYEDVTRKTRLSEATLPHVTWGCCIGDFENDGDRDLFFASGHLDHRNQGRYYRASDLVMKNQLLETGQLRFADISRQAGGVSGVQGSGRGAAIADFDNDGDLDIVVLNLRDYPTLLENRSLGASNRWLKLQLVGRRGNRDALGAHVRVVTDRLSLVDEVRNGRGYQSYWGDTLHFGVGASEKCERIEILWPDGLQQIIENVGMNQLHIIVQPDLGG